MRIVIFAAVILGVHASGIFAFAPHAMLISYTFILSGPLIAIACCLRLHTTFDATTAWKWTALCIGVLLWESGTAMAAWQDLLHENTYMLTAVNGLVFFLFGVPILLTICASRNERRLPAVAWIDGIMAAAVGILSYREIFSYLPGLYTPQQAPDVTRAIYAFDAENILLATLASVRLIAANSAQEQVFYRALCSFLWTYAAAATFYNHVAVFRWQLDVGSSSDLVLDVPFLVLAGSAYCAVRQVGSPPAARSRVAVTMIPPAITASLPFVLLSLGLLAFPHSPTLGAVSVAGSLAGYAFRNALSQAQLQESQNQLQESQDQLLESHKVLERAAFVDPLTGVGNRRAFDQALASAWDRCSRFKRPLGILIIDVDYFKYINDQYGHQKGDEYLVAVAKTLTRLLERGFLARYGGEEFACILPAADVEYAATVGERLRAGVQDLRMENARSQHQVLTVSIGATVCRNLGTVGLLTLVQAADQALYEAKKNGRNRVAIALTESQFEDVKAS